MEEKEEKGNGFSWAALVCGVLGAVSLVVDITYAVLKSGPGDIGDVVYWRGHLMPSWVLVAYFTELSAYVFAFAGFLLGAIAQRRRERRRAVGFWVAAISAVAAFVFLGGVLVDKMWG